MRKVAVVLALQVGLVHEQTRTSIFERDILFDALSVRIHNSLADVGDVTRLPEDSVDPAVASALNDAAAIYRARVRPTRRAANEAWIASSRTLLVRYEASMSVALATAYRDEWPLDPVLVDLVGEVGPNSAITHAGPPGYGAQPT